MSKESKEQLNHRYKLHYRKKKLEALEKGIKIGVPVTGDLTRMSSEFREAYNSLGHDKLKEIYNSMTVRSFAREYRISPNTCIGFFGSRIRGRKTWEEIKAMNKKKGWNHPGGMNDAEFELYNKYGHMFLKNEYIEMELVKFQEMYKFRAHVLFNLFGVKYSTGKTSNQYDTQRYVDHTREKNLKKWGELNGSHNKEYFERQKKEIEFYSKYGCGYKSIISFGHHEA